MSPELRTEIQTKAVAAAEAVYRITDVPGFDVSLREALRGVALRVVSAVTALGIGAFPEGGTRRGSSHGRASAAVASVDTARVLLSFAGDRGAIALEYAAKVLGTYQRIQSLLGELLPTPPATAAASSHGGQPWPLTVDELNDRQRRILDYLAENSHAQISQLRELFGDAVSEKTLQRDLLLLVAGGAIQRSGDNRWTTYRYRNRPAALSS